MPLGSPPPMRGKAWIPYFAACSTRITPAYAGKSMRFNHASSRERDHPRLCGEKCNFSAHVSSLVGSPPPMRGKANVLPSFKLVARITPAYAGKSTLYSLYSDSAGDHPRLCGEKGLLRQSKRAIPGSPPPMRGKDRNIQQKQNQKRITPAYAGKSSTFQSTNYLKRDHPRLCGEKSVVCGII